MDAKEATENASVRRTEMKRLENLQKMVEPLLQDADHLNKMEYKLQRCMSALRAAEADKKLLCSNLQAAQDALAHHKNSARMESSIRTATIGLGNAQAECQIAAANRRAADMHAKCTDEAARRADAESRTRVLDARCTVAERRADAAERAAQNALKMQCAAEKMRDTAQENCKRFQDVHSERIQQVEEEHAKELKALQEKCDEYKRRCESLELRIQDLEKTRTPLPAPRSTSIAVSPTAAQHYQTPMPLHEWDLISPAPLMRMRRHVTTPGVERSITPPRVAEFGAENIDGVSDSESRSRDTGDMPFESHDLFYDVPRADGNSRDGEEQEEKEVLSAAAWEEVKKKDQEEEALKVVPVRESKGSRKRPFASRRTRVRARSAGIKRYRRSTAQLRVDAGRVQKGAVDDMPAVGNTEDVPLKLSNGEETAAKYVATNSKPNGTMNGKQSPIANWKEKTLPDLKAKGSRKSESNNPLKPTSVPPAPAVEVVRRSRRARAPVSYKFSPGNDICTSIYDFMPHLSTVRASAAPTGEEVDASDRAHKRNSLPSNYRVSALGSPVRMRKRRGSKSARNT